MKNIVISLAACVAMITQVACSTTKAKAPAPAPTVQVNKQLNPPTVQAPAVLSHPLLTREPATNAPSGVSPLMILSRPGPSGVGAPTAPAPSARRALIIGKTGSDYTSVLFRNRTGKKTRVMVDNGVADFTLEDKEDQVILVERGVSSILYDAEHDGGRDLQELSIGGRNAIVVTIVK